MRKLFRFLLLKELSTLTYARARPKSAGGAIGMHVMVRASLVLTLSMALFVVVEMLATREIAQLLSLLVVIPLVSTVVWGFGWLRIANEIHWGLSSPRADQKERWLKLKLEAIRND